MIVLVIVLLQILCSTPHVSRQLTKLPASQRRSFSRACVDAPSEADVFEARLRDGDIIVAYVRLLSNQPFRLPVFM